MEAPAHPSPDRPNLFKDYVERIVGVLQQTLSLGGAGSRAVSTIESVPMPSITAPAAEQMRLADGQRDGAARRVAWRCKP